MPNKIKVLPHYTYDDYCHWEGRWEIIEGIPWSLHSTPFPRHQKIANKIKYELTGAILKSGCKECTVYDFLDIKIAENTVVQPDALIVCKKIVKRYLDFPAALVVEVLSPSTAMKDRNNKFYIYQSQKIPYYIIIDADKNEIEVYHLKEDGKYQLEKITLTDPYTFILDEGCSIDVILHNIWS